MGHVLFFSNHLRGPKGAAGARSWHQAKCLSESHDVTVVIPAVDPVTSQIVSGVTYEGLDPARVGVVRIPTFRNRRESKLSRALYMLSAMVFQAKAGLAARRPDLVLSMSLPVTQLAVAAMVGWIRRVPLIVDVRDMPFETAGEVGYIKSSRILAALKWLETKLLGKATIILTNSPYYKRYLSERGLSQERIHIAPIGYDDFGEPAPEQVNEWRARLRALFEPQPPEFIGVYAGTLGHAFPVNEILDGAAELKGDGGIGFVFFGDGQRLDEYRTSSEEREIRAKFPGRVSKSDIHAICRAADFCIYPASPGKFSCAILGNKVFDYLGAGKAIIYIGDDSAVSDVISELKAGIICRNKSPADFSRAVLALRDNPELRGRLEAGARSFRSAGYTARASAELLLGLVERSLGKSEI